MNEPKFEWLPEERIAFCTLVDPVTHREYVGTASCHEDDIDMCNEKTGCEIALRRAAIEAYKTLRDETKAALGALKQLFYSMNMSKKYNSNSYEARMLRRQIKFKESELKYAKYLLETERTELRDYISGKEKFYQNIRAQRKRGQD